ncbi:MAG: trypsin-like peptidase domain-containing protein [Streptomyces sp.]|uniref:nSTAND1 domain-containing NTPase n=1 Tax=Streptomyces sp. TaxID=1931 RepID=UPI0025CF8697|nr:trypsin-like peptidase domain-containing protein [Streptomyces sp.]MBW8795606.1 trypsin-like peptidase domain-containing protein [Streptomyces sp.]
MTSTDTLDSGVGRGGPDGFSASVAQVLGDDGRVVGAGFLAAEDTVLTCAHVVVAAGSGPGGRVRLSFPAAAGRLEAHGRVTAETWSPPDGQDIAVVRLDRAPADVSPLPLGSAASSRGHRVLSFGFPTQAPATGHFGRAEAGGLLPATSDGDALLQLTAANDLTTGFSGAPLVDELTGLVVGMVTAIAAPDDHLKGLGIAYATPADALAGSLPDLALRDICPYVGLDAFTAEQARWFHGRDDAVEKMLVALAGHRKAVLLTGPSGAGKSSVVQAGLLPALADGRLPDSDRWLPVLARPGQDLLAELERAGLPGTGEAGLPSAAELRLEAEAGRDHLLLVVDQFEELFTQSPGTVEAVTDELTRLTALPTAASLVLVIRDDFYPHMAATAPALLEAVAPGLVNIPATLSRQDLQTIITSPAHAMGARFEDGLAERIVTDVLAADSVGATTGRAPAVLLPLLELTLSQLWRRRENGALTHRAYQAIGEVTGALTTWCNTAVADVIAEHRPVVERILTALVRPADESGRIPAVRQQMPLSTLRDLAGGAADTAAGQAFDEVLTRLTRHRIVITRTQHLVGAADEPGEPVAELIHDALIKDWAQLRDWVARDRSFHDWLRRVREQHSRWAERRDFEARDPDVQDQLRRVRELPRWARWFLRAAPPSNNDLLHGTDLALGREWSAERGLPGAIAAFIERSYQHQQANVRGLRRLNALLAGVLVIALITAGGAVWLQQQAVTAQRQAQSREIAAWSGALLQTDPDLAALLAVHAYRSSTSDQAVASLYAAANLPLRRRIATHSGVVSLAYTKDGRGFAEAEKGGTIQIRDGATGQLRVTIMAPHPLLAMAYSQNGQTVATLSGPGQGYDNALRLWDATTGKARTASASTQAQQLALSPDGRTVAISGGGGSDVELRSSTTGRRLAAFSASNDTEPDAVAFSPDGRTLAKLGDDGFVRLWDIHTGKERTGFQTAPGDHLTGHANGLSVAFSPDGSRLATGDIFGIVRIRDAHTGKTLARLSGHTSGVTSVAFSPDGHTLATAGEDHTVRLWDVDKGTARATLVGHTSEVTTLAFDPRHHTLISGSTDRTLRVWYPDDGVARTTLPRLNGSLQDMVVSTDGRTLAVSTQTLTDVGNVRLFDVGRGKLRVEFTQPDDATALAFSPDGQTLAVGSDGDSARLWDATTGKRRHTPSTLGNGRTLVYSPDGTTLAIDGSTLWDVRTGTSRNITGKDEEEAPDVDDTIPVTFSPNGKYLAAVTADRRKVRIWDLQSGKVKSVLGSPGRVLWIAFAPKGLALAVGSDDGTVRIWKNTLDETPIAFRVPGGASSLAFSPDGRVLAIGGSDGGVRLWDAPTGQIRKTLTVPGGGVTYLAFASAGRTLAVAADDSTVRLFDIALPTPDQAVNAICRAVGRELTPQEADRYLHNRRAERICIPN